MFTLLTTILSFLILWCYHINLTANEWHEIEALEDNTVFINVFADVEN